MYQSLKPISSLSVIFLTAALAGSLAVQAQPATVTVATHDRDFLAGMQEMNLQVKERFEAEGIEFAFPTQTLHLKPASPVSPPTAFPIARESR